MGAQGKDTVEIVSGLSAGEEVVTRANFLVDSESRLRASLAAMAGGARLIKAIIRFSAENRILVIGAVLATLALAFWTMRNIPLDALPGPLRHPGHRLLALGPQPRHPRGPGHLPHHHGAARRTQGEGHPRLLRLRLQLRLRHLRGRHRPLLGADAGAGVPLQDHAPAPAGREGRSSGPTPPRVGWVFQYALVDRTGQHASDELRSFQDWIPALRRAGGARRLRGGHRRRPGAPVPDHRQPQPPRRLQATARGGASRRCGAATTTWAGGSSSSPAASTWCAAAAT